MSSQVTQSPEAPQPGDQLDRPPPEDRSANVTVASRYRLRFWGIFVGLCLLSFISALDVAIITTSLPTITAEIGGARQYLWIANSFVLCSSVPQPLYGQLANAFGRRIPFLSSVVLFILGSGIAGGASNPSMLIAGRSIQGVGAGGIYVLLDIVCCDLVPLRERGKYLGLMFSWSGLAAALGPVVGGALAQQNWRWIFYMNIPICGLAFAVLVVFLRVKTGAELSASTGKHQRIDYIGTAIFIPSMVALLYGLIAGGVQDPWSSWRIILPLVLGICGWILFHVHQSLFCSNPSVPTRLFGNRTSAAAFALTFLSSVLVQALSYFLPIYFQAVKGTTILESGTFFLPFAIGTLVFAVIAGVLLSVTGKYKPIHATAFALSAIGYGLLTLLREDTPKVAWAFIQLVASAGSGLTLSVMLPAIMAGLPEADVASASASYSFIRTFGYVWGVTIPSTVFNSGFDSNLSLIEDEDLREQLSDGAAYGFASQVHALRESFDPSIWDEVVRVYLRSLKNIWWIGLGISILSFFIVFLEKSLELRKELDTNYGLEEGSQHDTDNGPVKAVDGGIAEKAEPK
ncbi:MFS general substrate transporter [Thozetella sp. PMI_491]|nr:MFS general substrate transporter [Thozetella sp. PMI_491]